MIFTDQLQRRIQLNSVPKRIVSLVPSQTELLVDLGLENTIVGVTKFCIHPNQLRKEKQVVGGTKHVHLDKIKALSPDIILCNKEENTKEMIEALEQIAPVHISDIMTLEDAFELIEMYGALFHVIPRASEVVDCIRIEREQFQAKRKGLKTSKVAYFIWKDPWMVVASNTFIDAMLKEAGFQNVFKNEDRYPEIDLDHPQLNVADKILLSSEPYPFKQKQITELKHRFQNKEIHIVDGEMFSWYGSRLQKAYRYFLTLNRV